MDVPFDLWGQRGRPGVDVVGESHYADAIRAVFGSTFQPGGCELRTTAQLVPEPWNRHDPDAVAVWVGENQVGYLPRHDAGRYTPVLARLIAERRLPQVAARLWAAADYRGRPGLTGSVRIDLAEPHLIAPVNREPGRPYRLLPPGNSMPVTGEGNHLAALLGPEGECWAYATLYELIEPVPGGSRSVLEVRLDGAPVGRLTPRMSAELLPAVRLLATNSQVTAARALLKGPQPEVLLYAARAHELPSSWLGNVTPAAAGPAIASPATASPATPGPAPAGPALADPGGDQRPPSFARLGNAAPAAARGPAGVPSPPGQVPGGVPDHAGRGPGGAPNSPGRWDRIDAGNSAATPGRAPVGNHFIPVNAGAVDTLPGVVNRPGPHQVAGFAATPARHRPIPPPPAAARTPVDVDRTGLGPVVAEHAARRTPESARAAARVSVPSRTSPPGSPVAPQHGPIPPPPTGFRFAAPPIWPQPPSGWTPPTGWRPDPGWPPAPPDWQWWVPYWD
jgi:hypothetical protein